MRMKKKMNRLLCLLLMRFSLEIVWPHPVFPQTIPPGTGDEEKLTPFVLTVQPIITRNNSGTEPASMDLPVDLVTQAFRPAGIGLAFLEPLFLDHTAARDGRINLDTIVEIARKRSVIREDAVLIHLFFVNRVDGRPGPLGRGLMNGNITFVALSGQTDSTDLAMTAFAIAHEIGHNLGLKHAADDPDVSEKSPNLMGEGRFSERIGPRSLTPSQVATVRQSRLVRPRVDLLSESEGRSQLTSDSFDSFFRMLQPMELAAYTQEPVKSATPHGVSVEAKVRFAAAVMEFTPPERQALTALVGQINTGLLAAGMTRMALHPWRLIKVQNQLCGGFSFTRGLCIVLPEKRVARLTEDWLRRERDTAWLPEAAQLLVHEQVHVWERFFPWQFACWFEKGWGFVRAVVESCEELEIRRVTNPDAVYPEWVIPADPSGNRCFWVRVIFRSTDTLPQLGRDFVETVVEVKKSGRSFRVVRQKGAPRLHPMSAVAGFTNRFPVTTGIDHPNEIAAYMFASWFCDQGIEPSDSLHRRFIAWCREQFR